jgi:hypothetical protein
MMMSEILASLPAEWLPLAWLFAFMAVTQIVKMLAITLQTVFGAPLFEESSPKLNLDKHGMPQDYASYMWVLYKKIVNDA